MPRLVRKAPLRERLQTYLDPYDLLLRLAELLNDDTYDEWLNEWAIAIGLGLNVIFIFARGTSKAGSSTGRDDVFADPNSSNGAGWLSWFVSISSAILD